jgi:hypothetical protein
LDAGPGDRVTRSRRILIGIIVVGGLLLVFVRRLGCNARTSNDESFSSQFDPPAIDWVQPGEQGAVLAFGSEGAIDVGDPAARGLGRLRGSRDVVSAVPGHLDGVWWSTRRGALLIKTTTYDTERQSSVWRWTPGAPPTRVVDLASTAPVGYGNHCSLLDDADRLACVVQGYDPSSGRGVVAREVVLHSLSTHRSAERTAWTRPPVELGAAVVAPDARSVYFSDRCGGEEFGDHCIFRAALDGSDRRLVGPVDGNVCTMVVSRDGAHLALGASGKDYTDPCSHLWVIALVQGSAPQRIADFLRPLNALPGSYRGVSQIAFSPDGARMALLSDEEMGCAGSQGISVCSRYMSIVSFDGQQRARVGSQLVDGSLAWMPR